MRATVHLFNLLLEFFLVVEKPPHCLGIGAPIVDLIAPVSEEFLACVPNGKGGSRPLDKGAFLELLSALPQEPRLVPGGSCANTIKGIARLGGKAAFFGKIGKDSAGELFEEHLVSAGVEAIVLPCEEPTGQVLSLVTPDGDRTQRFLLGASNLMGAVDLHSNLFEGRSHVHFEGYQVGNRKLIEEGAALAHGAGALVSLDLGSFEIVGEYRDRFLFLIENHVDILFGNEQEIETLLEESAEKGCGFLMKQCPVVVVLMGRKGCLVGHEGRVQKFPVKEVEAIDSTGAGDLFASGFLYCYVNGDSVEACAQAGNLLGSTVVQVLGGEIPEDVWPGLVEEINSNRATS